VSKQAASTRDARVDFPVKGKINLMPTAKHQIGALRDVTFVYYSSNKKG